MGGEGLGFAPWLGPFHGADARGAPGVYRGSGKPVLR